MRWVMIVISALALSMPAFPARAQAPNDPSGSTAERAIQERIQRLYREAKAAGDRGDMQAAYELMLQAWRLRRAADVAVNLARIEMSLGKWRDAAEHLAFGLDHFPADADPKLAELNRERLATCKQKVVTLELRIQPSTARVLINRRDIGVASSLPSQVFVEPGRVEVAAFQSGYEEGARVLDAQAGETRPVNLVLIQGPPSSSSTAPVTIPPAEQPRPERTLIPIYVGGGLALVAAALGTGFLIDANSEADRSDELLASAVDRFGSNQPCAPSRGAGSRVCRDLDEAQSNRNRSLTVAQVSFVAGGVLLAGAVGTYFLWPQGSRAAVGSLQVDGYASATERGLRLRGVF